MTGPAIRCRGLEKRYPPAVQAVDGLDLEVKRGECFGLLGPNGAGKTTTVEILEGLLEPTAGEVEVLGRRWGQDDEALRQAIGLTLQETHLYERLTVRELVALFRSFYPSGRAVDEVIGLVSLEEKAGTWYSRLSGGQRQRLAVATALVGDPELLFLDEPTTGLDPQIRHALWDVIRRLKDGGLTVLLTTHYMEEAARVADRVVVLHKGRVVAEGAPDDLVRRHLRRYVLELRADDAPTPERLGCAPADIRRLGDRVLAFHDDESVLRAAVGICAARSAYVRPSSLEDVFLELTGSSLDA